MARISDLSRAELVAWAADVLARHGIRSGAAGYDAAELVAIAEAHGWGWATEHRQHLRAHRSLRETVFERRLLGVRPWVASGPMGEARTDPEALAIALA
jgi:hypothetical protein